MCDLSCWTAMSPPSHCQCDCDGANHGGGVSYAGKIRLMERGLSHSSVRRLRKRIFMTYAPTLVIQRQASRVQSVGQFFANMGKTAITNAVIYGLSAAVPPFGAVAIPAYTAYGYLNLGKDLFNAYKEIRDEGSVRVETLATTSGSFVENVSGPVADSIASSVVKKAQQNGIFNEIAVRTGVDRVVYEEMVKGSTSSALSTGGGELAKFVIQKAVGA